MTDLVDRRVEGLATVELKRRGAELEVWVDGQRTMATDVRRSERKLLELAVAPLAGREDLTVLIAGLGMGFLARAALDCPGVQRVDIIESSPAIVEWNRQYFAAHNGDVLRDPRVHVHAGELQTFLKSIRLGQGSDFPPEGWFALLLDTDEGTAHLSHAANRHFYEDDGLAQLEAVIRPGGVLALWSSARETEVMKRMHARLQNVAEIVVPVDLEGVSGLDFVYRGRRHPPPPVADKPAN